MTQTGTSPARRGILYVKWGANDAVLNRSLVSVRAVHPELPIHIHRLPDSATLLDKAGMFRASPFEETLFLDVDTVVMGRLEFGFEMAVRHHLACSICECPWARRYGGISGDAVEYNTGVLFFTRKAEPIFERWAALAGKVDSSIRFYGPNRELRIMPYNDQASFSLAVAEADPPPFILPYNWNFRPLWNRSWWGPIKIWHDYSDPPPAVQQWNEHQSPAGARIQYARFDA